MKFGTVLYDGFDWDLGNFLKSQKHGVPIEEIEDFFSKTVLYFEDHRHSGAEKRWIAVGQSAGKRTLFVAFTYRKQKNETLIRVISARYTHKKEQKIYESIKESLLKKNESGSSS